MASFFLVIAPGLEALALEEVKNKVELLQPLYPQLRNLSPKLQVQKGGIDLESSYEWGWILNSYLKIPTRILLRLESFPAKDFPRLFQKISGMNWSPYLRDGEVHIHVASGKSKLKIKERVEETAAEALLQSQTHRPWRKKFLDTPQELFLRLEENVCTLSIGTSGESLYKRGYGKKVGLAPIRETLASALVQQILELEKTMPPTWIDPLCGSGTLLFEAQDFYKPLNRKFSYQNFPMSARHQIEGKFTDLKDMEIKLYGSDADPSMIRIAKENASLRERGEVSFDVCSLDQVQVPQVEGDIWIVANPPYNVRIATDLRKMGLELWRLYQSSENIRGLGVFWPTERLSNWPGWERQEVCVSTSSGGVPVSILVHHKRRGRV